MSGLNASRELNVPSITASPPKAKLNNLGTLSSGNHEKDRTNAQKEMENFLQLLTTQLKHQDPTDPLDINQQTAQITQFNSLLQQINTNESIADLTEILKNPRIDNLVSYIGNKVTADTATGFLSYGSPVDFAYSLNDDAATTKINLLNSSGHTIATFAGEREAGNHTFTWDGKLNNGAAFAQDGAYSVRVLAWDKDSMPIHTSTLKTGVAKSVSTGLGGTKITLVDGTVIDSTKVSSVATSGFKDEA